jgi:hypothetical protein
MSPEVKVELARLVPCGVTYHEITRDHKNRTLSKKYRNPAEFLYVVPVDGQSSSNDPFRLTERNGRLYGRGAADMKGFDACCLAGSFARVSHRKIAGKNRRALSHEEPLTEGSFRQTGRNLDIRLGSCEGIMIPGLRRQRRSGARLRGKQGRQSHLIPLGSVYGLH